MVEYLPTRSTLVSQEKWMFGMGAKDPSNSPRRELALILGDHDRVFLGEEVSIGKCYELLLEWASDTDKRDFLTNKDLKTRYWKLFSANSREPDDEIERLSQAFWGECKQVLRITPEQEQLILQHSWIGKPKFKHHWFSCRAWVVLVLSHLIKKDIAAQ